MGPRTTEQGAGHPTGHRAAKQKQQALKQAQEEFLAKHINSNGPQDKEPIDPLDFLTLPVETLNLYRRKFNLEGVPEAMTDYGAMLSTGKTFTERSVVQRITKDQLAEAVKAHFLSQNVKETDVIANFVYTVHNEGEYLMI